MCEVFSLSYKDGMVGSAAENCIFLKILAQRCVSL